MIRFTLAAAVVLSTYAQPSAAFDAKVLSTTGGVSLQRGERSLMARERLRLRKNDRIGTLADSGASLLVGSSIVYLSEATQTKLSEYKGVPTLIILRGQVRVVATEHPGIHVITKYSRARLREGILRVETDHSGSRLAAIAGITELQNVPGRQELELVGFMQGELPTLQPGEEILIPSNGVPSEIRELEELRERAEQAPQEIDSLQDQAADAAELQLEDQELPPSNTPANNPPASGLRAGGGTGGAISSQNNVISSSISASLTGFSASFAGSASGGLFADANQSTNQGQLVADPTEPFPGNIHLTTTESKYSLPSVSLTSAEQSALFNGSPADGSVYYSIGEGALPTAQVFTDFLSASDATPTVLSIPGTPNYVVKLTQFGLIDAGIDPVGAEQNNIGITGLTGADPAAPLVVNATPLADDRGPRLNDNATFALGEFRLSPEGDSLNLAIRRSDQDRLIEKDPGGNDALDIVTPNPDQTFVDIPDPRFQPATPTVKSPVSQTLDPNTQDAQTRFSGLNRLRRAAVTTVLADQLHDFGMRTGQTRFVVDGRIIDISGYQKQ